MGSLDGRDGTQEHEQRGDAWGGSLGSVEDRGGI